MSAPDTATFLPSFLSTSSQQYTSAPNQARMQQNGWGEARARSLILPLSSRSFPIIQSFVGVAVSRVRPSYARFAPKMSARQPQRSLITVGVAGGSAHQDQAVLESDLSTSHPTASSPRLGRMNENHRADHGGSLSYSLLRSLAQHPHRITYLSTMIAFLKLDDTSWNYLQHLRRHPETSAILQPVLPHLYNIPADLAYLLEGIRSDPEWSAIKEPVIKIVECMHLVELCRLFL